MTTNHNRRSLFVLLICAALLIPVPGATALGQEATGSIDVEIYACPEDIDPSIALDQLMSACRETADPIGILVTNASGYFQLTGTIGTGQIPQRASVDSVPAGEIVITPQLPGGYDKASVYCREDGGPTEAITPNLDGGAPWGLQADARLACQVFVFPVASNATPVASSIPAASSLTVFVHGCPAGFEGASAAELVEICTGHPLSGLYVSDLPGYYGSASTTGIAGENSVTFADMEGTDFSLIYMYPRSVTTLAILCDDGSGNDDHSTWRAGTIISGMSTQLSVEPGSHVTCHWFNDAGDVVEDSSGNTLEVKAWNCPAEVEPGDDSWTTYLRECEDPATQTTFALEGAGAPKGTVSNDWNLWQGIPAGEFTLDASVPDGFGTPMIFCATIVGDRTHIEAPVMPTGTLPVVFGETLPQLMSCNWFNFPTGEGSPEASANPALEISVYTCPSFTFVGPAECVVDDSGIDLSLMQWNGDPVVWSWEVSALVQIGGDGVHTFEDLESGDYWPLANDGAWCHVKSEQLDSSGRWIDVEPGAVTTVALYTCGSPEA